MKRRTHAVVYILLLLPVLAVCVLWARSYRVTDIVIFKSGGGSLWFFHSTSGTIEVQRISEWPDEGVSWWLTFPLPPDEIGNLQYPGLRIDYTWKPPAGRWTYLGVRGTYGPASGRGRNFLQVDAPVSLFAIVLGAWPLVLTARLVRRALVRWLRSRRGCCISCGYDLRGSKERCPECGTSRRTVPALSSET